MTENQAVRNWRKRARNLPPDIHVDVYLDHNPYDADVFYLTMFDEW